MNFAFTHQESNRQWYMRGGLHGNLTSFDRRNIMSWLCVSWTPREVTYRFTAKCTYQYITGWESSVWLFDLDQIAHYVSTGERLTEQEEKLAHDRWWGMAQYYATLGITSYYLPSRWHHLCDRKVIRYTYYFSWRQCVHNLMQMLRLVKKTLRGSWRLDHKRVFCN